MPNTSVSAFETQDMLVPKCCDSSLLAAHNPRLQSLLYVPQLDVAGTEPNTKISSIVEVHARDVSTGRCFTQLEDWAGSIGPTDVNRRFEIDDHHV